LPSGLRVHVQTREEQIADFEDAKAAGLLMELHGIWETAATNMEALIGMLRGAAARLLGAGCAALEKEKQQKRSKT
jgi:hypothetical protein